MANLYILAIEANEWDEFTLSLFAVLMATTTEEQKKKMLGVLSYSLNFENHSIDIDRLREVSNNLLKTNTIQRYEPYSGEVDDNVPKLYITPESMYSKMSIDVDSLIIGAIDVATSIEERAQDNLKNQGN